MIENPKRHGLGRGLAALMGDKNAPAEAPPPRGLRELPIEQLKPNPYQPRTIFNEAALNTLADSIRQKGLLQPILVRRTANPASFEIVAGERRWRAAQLAQLHTVPVVVREIADKEAAEIGLIENVQREDLNPIEEAAGYGQLLGTFGYSQEQVAEAVGRSVSHVSNTLRLLKLPDAVLRLVAAKKLNPGQVRPLIGHPQAEAIAQQIADGRLTARQVEALMRREGAGRKPPPGKKPRGRQMGSGRTKPSLAPKDADTLAFERSLTQALGMSVEVQPDEGSAEAGRLSIRYISLEQLDEIAKKLSRR